MVVTFRRFQNNRLLLPRAVKKKIALQKDHLMTLLCHFSCLLMDAFPCDLSIPSNLALAMLLVLEGEPGQAEEHEEE